MTLLPNSASYANTKLTSEEQARTHSHLFPLVGYPCTENSLDLHSLESSVQSITGLVFLLQSDLNGSGH